ncbi:hypothetical protein [Carboxylicivirga marina]|uniref:Uncharacterized protein n=1 Tax=Carboxylicivirga marina TaxID=2800988 RepID=A0ABS1HG22_9BACT|nr:hypothetical protein [Carboxylicivirga marina]MBK3516584.1 hypothetical protein [Carboxylicivirga marina]
MKRFRLSIGLVSIGLLLTTCTQDAEIEPETTTDTNTILKSVSVGFDEWGFNYRAHLFEGYLINAMFADPVFKYMPHYKKMNYNGQEDQFWNEVMEKYPYFSHIMPGELIDCKLMMKWNEDLLSKEGQYPDTWVDSDAWIVFKYKLHTMSEQWTHVRRLVARKGSDYLDGGYWYNQEGEEIGKESYYWPDLIITQVVNNGNNPFIPAIMPDDYLSPNGVGQGKYKVK